MYRLHDPAAFLLKCFLYVGGNAKFQVLFGNISKRNIAKKGAYLQCTIETISVSIYETVDVDFQG